MAPAVGPSGHEVPLLAGVLVAVLAALALTSFPLPGLLPTLNGWRLLGLGVYGVALWSVTWHLLLGRGSVRA